MAKFTLRKVRVDKQGYVMNTYYYGLSEQSLWWYCSDDGKCEDHIRAWDRKRAKFLIREKHPDARFYN